MKNDKDFLGTQPVGKLLLNLALPTVTAQLINMLYNIVDRIYIGHIPKAGAMALTGVGVCMPLIMIVAAFAALVGNGGSPRASIAMGKGDNESAEDVYKRQALALFLKINRNTDDTIFFILFVWSFMLLGGSLLTFCQKKRRADRLLSMAEKMKERYLLPEIMDRPQKAEEAVYYRILKLAEKSMLEEIGLVKRERREYREYIEQWIHEVKTPITAMKLLCENNRSRVERELLKELERVQGLSLIHI